MTSLQQPHHDGSELYVSDPHPDLGDAVSVFVRAPQAAGVSSVHIYAVRDGEPEYAEANIDRTTEHETWWRAEVEVHNPITRYRFLLDGGTSEHRWLTGNGVTAHDPTDVGDFRLSTFSPPPSWAVDAIFYQVFPDRFASSDTRRDLPAWAVPAQWDDPVITTGESAMQQFYGGDLPGLQQRLGHLEELGVNALYTTPFFPAASNHRYNAASFHHVDPLLGGDTALAALTAELHKRGMRIVGDLTPNHCGNTHPWFVTAQADAASVEAAFFSFTSHPQEYLSWLGVPTLPKFNHRDEELRWRLYEGSDSVLAHWLRPPFALDGWRMDVAHMTAKAGRFDANLDVSRAMRRTLQTVNPESLLIAEHPFDASEILQGDAYHGTMNYAGFARPVWSWMGIDRNVEFLGLPVPIPPLPGPTMAATMTAVHASLPWSANIHAFNQLGSHDTARFRTVVGGADAADAHLAAAGLLFTMPGIPVIFAGDEIGMEGADSLEARQPFPWNREGWDTETFSGYQRLTRLRRTHPSLRRGGFRWVHVGSDVVCFLRESVDERILVAVSRAAHPPVRIPISSIGATSLQPLLDGAGIHPENGVLTCPGSSTASIRAWLLPETTA